MNSSFMLSNLQILSPHCSHFFKGNLIIKPPFIDEVVSHENSSTLLSSGKLIKNIDLRGCYLMPAFWDSHLHLSGYARSLDFMRFDGQALDQIQKTVRNKACSIEKSDWLRGRGWEINCFENHAFPSRHDLDRFTLGLPAALVSKDGHTLWLNTRAIEILGYSENSTDPPGGVILRDSDSCYPSGIFQETAADEVLLHLPKLSRKEWGQILSNAIRELNKHGIAHIDTFEDFDSWNLFAEFDERLLDGMDIIFHFNEPALQAICTKGFRKNHRNIHIGGLKLFADGALGSRSALVSDPYSDNEENYGIEVLSSQQMMIRADTAARAGFGTSIHAIGDVAVSNALDALCPIKEKYPSIHGMRIEHCQMVRAADIARFRQSGIVASVQPCHLNNDIPMAELYWSRQRSLRYPYATFLRNEIPLVFGSDAPIENPSPWLSIQMAVTREQITQCKNSKSFFPQEKLSIQDALRSFTSLPSALNNRYVSTGKIIAHSMADLIVIDNNPFSVDPCDLHTIKTKAVFYHGCLQYDEMGLEL